MFNLRAGAVNIIKDRMLYDLCVEHSLFDDHQGNIEWDDHTGVICWRDRPDVKAFAERADIQAEIAARTTPRARDYAIQSGRWIPERDEQEQTDGNSNDG